MFVTTYEPSRSFLQSSTCPPYVSFVLCQRNVEKVHLTENWTERRRNNTPSSADTELFLPCIPLVRSVYVRISPTISFQLAQQPTPSLLLYVYIHMYIMIHMRVALNHVGECIWRRVGVSIDLRNIRVATASDPAIRRSIEFQYRPFLLYVIILFVSPESPETRQRNCR